MIFASIEGRVKGNEELIYGKFVQPKTDFKLDYAEN